MGAAQVGPMTIGAQLHAPLFLPDGFGRQLGHEYLLVTQGLVGRVTRGASHGARKFFPISPKQIHDCQNPQLSQSSIIVRAVGKTSVKKRRFRHGANPRARVYAKVLPVCPWRAVAGAWKVRSPPYRPPLARSRPARGCVESNRFPARARARMGAAGVWAAGAALPKSRRGRECARPKSARCWPSSIGAVVPGARPFRLRACWPEPPEPRGR